MILNRKLIDDLRTPAGAFTNAFFKFIKELYGIETKKGWIHELQGKYCTDELYEKMRQANLTFAKNNGLRKSQQKAEKRRQI